MTGRHSLDSTIQDGSHLVKWVRDQLHNKRDPVDISDLKQRGTPDARNAAAVSFLCISPHPVDRPIIKDVCNHEDSVWNFSTFRLVTVVSW
ncbi:putative LRR receptor-like serine/threonine-protein kinase [Artemisia annua]|uniref:Putative LRR receptor-like serine/threonine-protein kinase n=1 Tax=Artemisia annua TaxID=35608 RepID=A0A2U1MI08_ARTAN|nr:putative LRR receptor-like serine/threonine-protein kinase [Artemisia annua]